MLAILAPGQGSQSPGMLESWCDDPRLADLTDTFSAAAGLDLRDLGIRADADTVRDTGNAQPLIVAVSLLSALALFDELPLTGPVAVAGHSVGELAALALAGVVDSATAVTLAARRGAAMADAARATSTGMSAVVGGERADVLAAIEAAECVPANVNSAAQVVAAGTREQLDALAQNAPARSRVIPLQVAGAFHTAHMAPAQGLVAGVVAGIRPSDPGVPLLSNRDGETVATGSDALARIVSQITSPVRWDLCMARLSHLGVTAIVELAPGGVLTGLAKRELKGVPAVAITSPDDLDAARALLATERTA